MPTEIEHTSKNIQLVQSLSPNVNNKKPNDEEVKKNINNTKE